MLSRFRKTIPTVKSVSSSEIYKNFGFLPKLQFYPFSKNWNFLGSYNINYNHVYLLHKDDNNIDLKLGLFKINFIPISFRNPKHGNYNNFTRLEFQKREISEFSRVSMGNSKVTIIF